ncbi:glucosidase 2 subunit beta isoform X1 [Oncorhynchus kisutch]|uniref:glucosidase 2 subunit beta isoform X1 n=1 Tax=Oncorhynchus kisutch TaxID=8019 RepID=UPI0012DE5155|nr:glucosidase 2 subunit beta isoform X1 [Oncorhynchus kisutch]
MFTNCSLGHCHIVIAVILWSICVDSRKIRGISLSYKRFYRERKSFLCIDGSKMIPFDQVNDDYCDCMDGSDEPGTAACPNGRFYCTNLGYRSHYIPSSRVNDGICDCCDASDEYRSQTPCQNTCRNLGQRERAEVEGQTRVLGERLRLKQLLIEEGVLTWREKQAQLRDLQRVSDDLQTQLDDLRKEEARRKEEADSLREREIGARDTADNSPTSPYRPESPISVFKELDSNRDGSITVDEVQAKLSPVQDEEHALSEDEAVIKGRRGVPGSLADEDPNIKAAVSAAEKAAADLKRVEDAYETVYMEIRDLREKLSIDYGSEREFLFLHNQCFQLKVYEPPGPSTVLPQTSRTINSVTTVLQEDHQQCYHSPPGGSSTVLPQTSRTINIVTTVLQEETEVYLRAVSLQSSNAEECFRRSGVLREVGVMGGATREPILPDEV